MPLPDTDQIEAKAHMLPLLRAAMRALEAEQFDQSDALLDSLLKQDPDFADALHLKGYAAFKRGHLGDARKLVERAIAIDFHFENYHLTLGHILLAEGDRHAARNSFGAALVLNPNLPDSYIGLAHTFMAEGELDAAVGALRTARAKNPKHPEINYLLGFALMAQGFAKDAMMYFGRALQAAPDDMRYRAGFARSLSDLRLKKPDPALVAMTMPLLGTPGVEPRDLAPVLESAIRLDPAFAALSAIDDLAPADAARFLVSPQCPDPASSAVFARWLAHGLVMNPAIQTRLEALRRGLLHVAVKEPAGLDRFHRLLGLLAVRSFRAEYVDAVGAAERILLPILDDRLAGAAPPAAAASFAVYAAYAPLYRRADNVRLANAVWPEAFQDLHRVQLIEPMREKALAETMPALTPIDDATSRDVQDMYEESPFPRWHQPILGTPLSVAIRLRSALPLQTIPPASVTRPQVLVAGCGTGLHAILAATSYYEGEILAIDLSRMSLAYGKRKAEELKIQNVEFAQADILKVGSIDRRFDVIESFGVLHHLRDPAAGLAQLVSLLKPDGYMMLGLYSELGRRDVVAARDLIARHGYSDTPDDIRRFRSDLPRLAPELAERLGRSSAFHALSDLRDLVFHRQEHRYTPQQLRDLIDGTGLEFLGFEFATPKPLAQYQNRFPGDATATDLENWAVVEADNPDLFANCYRFWARRR